MTDLPHGWTIAPLGELVEVLDNQRIPVSAAERATRPGSVPYYGATGQVGYIDRAIFNEHLVLLGEDGVAFFDAAKPKAYAISGPSWVNNHAHVLRSDTKLLDQHYLLHYLNCFDYHDYATGTTRLKLTKSAMTQIPVRLPPLSEQRRIVNSLEAHISRLDAAVNLIGDVSRRTWRLELSTVLQVLSTVERSTVRLACLLREPLVNGRSVPTRVGGFPVLRLSALASGNIQLAERKDGAWSRSQAAPFLVKAGDYFISRGNGSLSLVGRGSAVTMDPDDVAFPDTMIRIRPNEELLMLPYLTLIWNLPMVRRQIEEKARTTAGIYKINQSVIGDIELPLPSREDQERVVQHVDTVSQKIAAARGSTLSAQVRATGLRRALFMEAFSGRMVRHDPADEPVSVPLERIREERLVQSKPSELGQP